jgi:hypothetical protein
MNITYDQCFSNMTHLPPEGTDEFNLLVNEEIEKCMGGVYIDGIFFSGFLYWHLNHWHIRDDVEDEYGNIKREKMIASLRDNEWIVSEYLEICRLEKKGYLHIGVRQFGKSEIMASYLGYHATLFEHTQNVIVGGNDDDLQLLRDKIDFGIKSLWTGIRIPKLDKDTKKNMTRLGFKAKGGDDYVWSYLIVRNVAEGNKTEGPAGVTAKAYANDEIGKFSFAQSFEAAKPAFKSKFGWRCVPLLFGTGGSFEKGADAERFFWNPEANNFLSVIDELTGKKTAIFMSGLYRLDCKYETTLGDYLRSTGKLPIDKLTPNLDRIKMQVSDKDKARELILKERAEKAKDPDRTEYLKLIMYYPLTPEECFLNAATNIYNVQSAKAQQKRLYEQGRTGTPVILYYDGGVKHVFTDKKQISSYPIKNNESQDAPVIIYEFPIEHPPFGLYVAGVDPYRQGKAEYSSSLGAVYIYKRMHDIGSEMYQDMFVASYVARPEKKDDWEEQARMLIKMYNARTLCENDDISFIEYMKAKGDSHYLEPQPAWLREVVHNSTVTREYGIHRSSDKIRDHLNACLKRYLEDVIHIEKDPNTGEIIRETLGVNRILDPILLEEIIKFNEDGNFDRQVAASLALALVYHLDPILGKVNNNDDPRYDALFKKRGKGKNKLFPSANTIFSSSKKKTLFK